jgi:uncharacterized protein
VTPFTGRDEDLARLNGQLRRIERSGTGRALIVTGRRRVGKSRLVQEFCVRSGLPFFAFQASRGRRADRERADLVSQIGQSSLPDRDRAGGAAPGDWLLTLRVLSDAVPADRPSIVVLDEVPWLVEQDDEFEGALQTAWDRLLLAKPCLLILVGSDASVMNGLQDYQRPFFGRAAPLPIRPLALAAIQDLTGLDAADTIDAALVTGGFPEVTTQWQAGMSLGDFLTDQLNDPLSPLLIAGQLTMLGEFPEANRARAVLEAIGAGERTFGTIAQAATGGSEALPSGALTPVLGRLIARDVVAADLPLSTANSDRDKRYRIADPYLRFWLAFLSRAVAEAERGTGDRSVRRVLSAFPSWRGRAVEPLIRTSLARLLPDDQWPDANEIGGWWNRQNNPEIDLVAADRTPATRSIAFAGSVKWLEQRRFDQRDLTALATGAKQIPGAENASLVAVSRAGTVPGLDLARTWTPADLVDAWR